MSTLKIEAGKQYLTRDGLKVIIDRVDCHPPYPIKGFIDGRNSPDRWSAAGHWFATGRWFERKEHSKDLISEVEPPKQQAPADLKLQVGKSYRTRNGKKAVISEILSQGGYPIFGRIEGNHTLQCWAKDGRGSFRYETHDDLVAEWVESTQPELTIDEMRALDMTKTLKELEHYKSELAASQARVQRLEEVISQIQKLWEKAKEVKP